MFYNDQIINANWFWLSAELLLVRKKGIGSVELFLNMRKLVLDLQFFDTLYKQTRSHIEQERLYALYSGQISLFSLLTQQVKDAY